MVLNAPTLADRIGMDLGRAGDAGFGARAAAAAEAGARLGRIRFALDGSPQPDDAFLEAARSAAAAARAEGLRLVAVLDSDLTVAPGGMGAFIDGASSALTQAWVTELLHNAERLARVLGDLVAAWEVLPAPNAGPGPIAGQRHRIAPGRWAALLSQVGPTLRRAAPGTAVVAGGLVSDDMDDGVDYLRSAYLAWDNAGLWTPDSAPFDVLAIQLNVLPGGGLSEDAVVATVGERVRRLWRVRESFEGASTAAEGGLLVTGIAWDASQTGEDVQARNTWSAFNTLTSEPMVRGVIWSSLVDGEGPHGAIGLFNGTSLAADSRRPAWRAYSDFALYARQIGAAAGPDLFTPTVPPVEQVSPVEPHAAVAPVPPSSAELAPTNLMPSGPLVSVRETPQAYFESAALAAQAPEGTTAGAGSMGAAEAIAEMESVDEAEIQVGIEAMEEEGGPTTPAVEPMLVDTSAAMTESEPEHHADTDRLPSFLERVSDEIDALIARIVPGSPELDVLAGTADTAASLEAPAVPIERSDASLGVETVAEATEMPAVEGEVQVSTETMSETTTVEDVQPQTWTEPSQTEPSVPEEMFAVTDEESPVDTAGEPWTFESTETSAEAYDEAPAGNAAAASSATPTQEVRFRVPSLTELLQSHGLEGAALQRALDALRSQLGEDQSLVPGEYSVHVPISDAGDAPDVVPPEVGDLTEPSGAEADTGGGADAPTDADAFESPPSPSLASTPPSTPEPEPSPEPRPAVVSNQHMINAIYRAGGNTWQLFERSGLVFSELALRRLDVYAGPAVEALEGLTVEERLKVLAELAAIALD